MVVSSLTLFDYWLSTCRSQFALPSRAEKPCQACIKSAVLRGLPISDIKNCIYPSNSIFPNPDHNQSHERSRDDLVGEAKTTVNGEAETGAVREASERGTDKVGNGEELVGQYDGELMCLVFFLVGVARFADRESALVAPAVEVASPLTPLLSLASPSSDTSSHHDRFSLDSPRTPQDDGITMEDSDENDETLWTPYNVCSDIATNVNVFVTKPATPASVHHSSTILSTPSLVSPPSLAPSHTTGRPRAPSTPTPSLHPSTLQPPRSTSRKPSLKLRTLSLRADGTRELHKANNDRGFWDDGPLSSEELAGWIALPVAVFRRGDVVIR